jgi:hypothetical protein
VLADPYNGRYATLRTVAAQAENIERVLLALENQARAFKADGWPEPVFAAHQSYSAALRAERRQLMRRLGETMAGTGLAAFIERTHGVGNALLFVVGMLPPLHEFAGPAKVWKYTGLHVDGGRAPRRKAGEMAGYSSRLRSYAIYRVAEPIVKTGGPYRTVYDERKGRTLVTHPDMLDEGAGCEYCDLAYSRSKASRAEKKLTRERKTVGFDCAAVGGVHWTAGHRHADALRVLAKAILRDAWRVANGYEARVGGQDAYDGQFMIAPALASS